MRQCDVRFDLKVFAFTLAAFAVLIATPSTLLAQGTGITAIPVNAGRATTVAMERAAASSDMHQRQWDLDHIKEHADKTFEQKRVSLYAQVKEDFIRLQVINNDMVYPAMTKSDFAAEGNKRLIEAVLEVKKRANRLKTNLLLPASEKMKGDQQEIANEEVKSSLAILNKTIISFVTNPFFQKPEVLNLEQTTRAKHDLNSIIKLSDAIQKRLKASTQSAQSR